MRLFIIPFTQKKAEPPKAEAEAEEKKESPKKESKLKLKKAPKAEDDAPAQPPAKRKIEDEPAEKPAKKSPAKRSPAKVAKTDAPAAGGSSADAAAAEPMEVEAAAAKPEEKAAEVTAKAEPLAAEQQQQPIVPPPPNKPAKPPKEVKEISPDDFFNMFSSSSARKTPPPTTAAAASSDLGKRRRDEEAAADDEGGDAAAGGPSKQQQPPPPPETAAANKKAPMPTASPSPPLDSPMAAAAAKKEPSGEGGGGSSSSSSKQKVEVKKEKKEKKAAAESTPAAAEKAAPASAAASPAAAASAAGSSPATGEDQKDDIFDEPAPPPPKKWHPGMIMSAPPNKGNKTYPVGKKNCLTYKDGKGNVQPLIFVMTGVLDSLEREECEAMIKKYGGKVTGSISGKTNYLLLGTDERGMPMEGGKATKAKTMPNCKILDEDGFLDILRNSCPQPAAAAAPPPAPSAAPVKSEVKSEKAVGGAGASSSSASAQQQPALPALPKPEGAEALWAEKYRPMAVEHLVGNSDHVRRLGNWLKTWEDENAKLLMRQGEKKEKGGKKEESSFMKAALLSGPPGVGKTSTAKVLLKHFGYDIVELNASDTRSEKAIKSMAGDMVGNQSIADFATAEGVGGKGFKGKNGKMALIMDEVDGMSAGDRGGVGMLVKIIADAKMPVICICNDRQSQKLKSLANHCLDLRFRRPANGEIKSALRRVVASEGYHDVDEAVLDKLAESCNADIRQMLNLLQIWRPRDGAAKLDGETVQNNLKSAFKDLDVGPWDVADRFFKAGNEDFEQKLRYYFVDNSMTPLLVHENYLSCQPFLPQRFMQAPPKFQDNWKFNQLAQAGDFLANGDVISQKVMGSQNFALMPLHGALSCVAPGAMMKGNGPGRLQFPSWLGRNSTATKRQRLLREATSHMSGTISASKCEVRQSYIPVLRNALLKPLVKDGVGGVEEVLDLLDEYGLTKDDFDAVMEMELLSEGNAKAAFSAVSAATKSALTRKYNQRHAEPKNVPKKAKKQSAGEKAALKRLTEDGEYEDDGPDDEGEESEEEDDEQPAAAAAKPSGSSKAAGKQPVGKGKARA